MTRFHAAYNQITWYKRRFGLYSLSIKNLKTVRIRNPILEEVEFKREDEIFSEYGKEGITEYDLILDDDVAEISDDTQMTLFTAEGMLLAGNGGVL